jgi:hypothetical protein
MFEFDDGTVSGSVSVVNIAQFDSVASAGKNCGTTAPEDGCTQGDVVETSEATLRDVELRERVTLE